MGVVHAVTHPSGVNATRELLTRSWINFTDWRVATSYQHLIIVKDSSRNISPILPETNSGDPRVRSENKFSRPVMDIIRCAQSGQSVPFESIVDTSLGNFPNLKAKIIDKNPCNAGIAYLDQAVSGLG